jgi:zinc transport system substrate-binding protein
MTVVVTHHVRPESGMTMKNHWTTRLGIVLLVVSISACQRSDSSGGGQGTAAEKSRVLVVNYPLQYLAERIAGDLVDVEFPAPRDIDPAFWEPTVEDIQAFQTADAVLLNGAGYAKWTQRVTLPESRLRVTTRTVSDQFIETDEAVVHQHGPEGEHEHQGLAFTTWLDPAIAAEQARQIRDVMIDLLPENADQFRSNCDRLVDDLLAIDRELESIVARAPDLPLVFSHPVYQYLVRRYGLNARDVHWEPDTMPDDNSLQEFQEMLADHPAKWMVWEAEPTPEIVERLESMGISSVVFAPMGNRPEEGDFLDGMQANVEQFRKIFSP